MNRKELAVADRPTLTRDQQRMADALRASLSASPRAIPPMFFYDALGSALFDAICQLPWYNVTRAELALLERHGADVGKITGDIRMVELGPGNGHKATVLARALARPTLDVHLVDISAAALATAKAALSAVDGVRVSTHVATYEAGLAAVDGDGRVSTLVAFLGSNIGNFDPHEAVRFLSDVRGAMRPGDWLLLGADLVKPERDLLLAYDDPLGVTAAFNKNVLQHINRELDGDFDLEQFAHRAAWCGESSRIEMHLVSLRRQRVTVGAADLTFTLEAGESIWTESSYKYAPEGIAALVETGGFQQAAQWLEGTHGFALTLFERK